MASLIDIARAEVGVRESGGANSGPRIRLYQAATWLQPGQWPWCAAFTCWALQQWLAQPEGRAFIGRKDPEAWRCRDASAFGWIGWAKARGLAVGRSPRPGDFVVYDFNGSAAGGGHIGICSSLLPDGKFRAIEGNTNGAGGREGDGVYEKTRGLSFVVGCIRLGSSA